MILRQAITFSLCAILCLQSGCLLVGPGYRVPAATTNAIPDTYKESPEHFRNTGNWKVARPSDDMLRGPWWKVFGDPQLNALEDRLNINNQNIKEFYQNYLAARAIIGEQTAQFYPNLTANGSYTRSRTLPLNPVTSIMTALDFSWVPDIWGKVRNAVRSSTYNAQLSAADLENERLIEQSSLAMIYFQLQGQDALEKLFQDTIVADKAALQYTENQYATGLTDQIAVVEATNTLQNAEATATNLQIARAQFEHAIAVLVGDLPSNFSMPVEYLTSSPPELPIGMPSQLLERRPDVAAAERAMAAANAQIGIAYAAYYPTVTLTGDGGFTANSFPRLFDFHNRFCPPAPMSPSK